jgi:hypothetical protein
LCWLEQLHCFGIAHDVSQRVRPGRAGAYLADRVTYEPVA